MALKFPPRFRQQVVHVVSDTRGRYYAGQLGVGREYLGRTTYGHPCTPFAIEELAVARLSSGPRDRREQILDYLLKADDDGFFWFLSLIVIHMEVRVRPFQRNFYPTYEEVALRSVDSAFSALNRHLESNDLPYRIVNGKLVDRARQVAAKQIEGQPSAC